MEIRGRAVMERKRTNAANAAAPHWLMCSEKLAGNGI
jgi:hypothetical protein